LCHGKTIQTVTTTETQIETLEMLKSRPIAGIAEMVVLEVLSVTTTLRMIAVLIKRQVPVHAIEIEW
jgi:hypothetical protein